MCGSSSLRIPRSRSSPSTATSSSIRNTDVPSGFVKDSTQRNTFHTVGDFPEAHPPGGAQGRLPKPRQPRRQPVGRGQSWVRPRLLDASSSSMVLALAALLRTAKRARQVFHSRSEAAGRWPSPKPTASRTRSLLLDDAQASPGRASSARSKARVAHRASVYRGYKGDALLGYAFIDVHKVRTQPEAFLVVLSPEGVGAVAAGAGLPRAARIHARWLAGTRGSWERRLETPTAGGRTTSTVSWGPHLSTRATSEGVRRALLRSTKIALEKGK